MSRTEDVAREKARKVYNRLLSYAKPGIGNEDYKADLMEMLGENKRLLIDTN